MKRVGHLFEQIVDYNNLLDAVVKARKGKQECSAVQYFLSHLHEEVASIQSALINGDFKFGGYHEFLIHDPKRRLIQAAPFPQRIVHHAIINVLGPVIERRFIFDSYACRIGKGQYAALKRVAVYCKKHPYYLKMDIRKYYSNIDHVVLKVMLERLLKDPMVLELLSNVIHSYCASNGRGLPIGNLTSQYFGNLYLDCFDHWIKEEQKIRCYLRYMDDMLLFGDKEELLALRNRSALWLAGKLRLEIKHGGELNRTEKGIPFLGHVIFPSMVRLNSRSEHRLRRKFRRLEKTAESGVLSERDVQERGGSIFAAALFADSLRLRRNLITTSRFWDA